MSYFRIAQPVRTVCCLLCLTALQLPAVFAGDWERFRGPNGTGVSDDKVAPTSWSNDENMQWKTALPGPGLSSPIVVGDKVFLTCYSGYGENREEPGNIDDLERHLVCVNRKSGDMLWQKSIAAVQPEDPYRGFITEHGYASQTPASDGEKVFVFFGKTGVLAFDLDGNQLWQTSVGTSSGRQKWGSAASPVLFENLVIVNASDESQSLVALNKDTGDVVWREENESIASNWSTPILLESGDGTDLVIAVVGQVWGRDPATGELKWFAKSERSSGYSTSLIAGDGVAYCAGGMQGGSSFAVRPGGSGDVSDTHVVWSTRSYDSIISPVLLDGRLYGVTNRGIAYAADAATGDKVYQTRIATGEEVTEDASPYGRRPGQGNREGARPGGPRGEGGARPEGGPRGQAGQRGPGGPRGEGAARGEGGQRGPGGPRGEAARQGGGQRGGGQRGGGQRGGGGRRGGGPGGGDYASPIVIDGKILAMTRSGTTFVIAPEQEFKVIAKNVISGDESGFYATPAVSEGQIFIRSNANLYCISGN